MVPNLFGNFANFFGDSKFLDPIFVNLFLGNLKLHLPHDCQGFYLKIFEGKILLSEKAREVSDTSKMAINFVYISI